MSISIISTTAHVCEDTNKRFELADLLIQAGYTPTAGATIVDIAVEQNGDIVGAPTPLVTQIDGDTIEITAGNVPNYFGGFSVFTIAIDLGNGNEIYLEIQVIIDPVNDAPTGTDKTVDIVDGSAYVINETDFGFLDPVEGNNLESVLVTSLPIAGELLLNGQPVTVGTEIGLSDIQSGRLSYLPPNNSSGTVAFGFQVRDDGDAVGCNASDLDMSANYLTFKIPFASLGDRVWSDDNGNGVQDGTEAGVAGVTVTAKGAGADGSFGTADDTTNTTTTDANGNYLFENLNIGKYQVEFSDIGSGKTFTTANQGGNDTTDSDADASGKSQITYLAPGENDLSIDAGLVDKTGSLGDKVFFDSNDNGLQDSGEVGVSGVTVTLTGAGTDGTFGTADDTTATATTDANGEYQFANLKAGQYQVQFSGEPSIGQYTLQNVGSDDSADSDADANGLTQVVTLAAGENNNTVDGGLVLKKATLGDTVFFDANNNGIQDAGDVGLSGVTVTATGAGSDGTFGTADDTSVSMLTDANGNYLFTGLNAGSYQVQFSGEPSIGQYTLQNVGGDDTIDSDADANGLTQVVTLAPGEVNTTIDGGLVLKKASLGDTVFLDNNGNGIQDAGDTGAAGVTVTLQGAGVDGTFGTADDVTATTTTDANGQYAFNNLTANQSYQVQFSNTPAGYSFTTQDAGSNDGLDSDVGATGLSQVVFLNPGEANLTLDAGLVAQKASLGDRVWLDANGNGVQDTGENGVAGVTVNLTGAGSDGTFGTADDVTRTTTTDSQGAYGFTNLTAGQYQVAFTGLQAGQAFTGQNAGSNDATDSDVDTTGKTQTITLAAGENNTTVDAGVVITTQPTACVGDRVWYDENKNGLQDSCEDGVAGVTVKLIGAGADGVFGNADDISKTTTTDSCGYYKFTGLTAGQQYQIQFGSKTGYGYTTQDVGSNNAIDSDANSSTGLTNTFTLGAGENNNSFDAGLICKPTASVGDRVWFDTDRDGIQESCEYGAAGVTVKLIGAGADGIFGNADDISKTTTTNSNGYYLFSGLAGGQQYKLEFGTLNGYTFTSQNRGTNDSYDSDVDSTGKTAAFTLADGQVNTTIDAGLVCRATASVGDRVWIDSNGNGVQDSGESGAACVTVKLIGAGADGVFGNADDISKTTTTDSCGNYLFTGLTGGQQYQVQFGTLNGYGFTAKDQGTSGAYDSDADSTGKSHVFTLADGEVNRTVDAGLVCKPTACVGDRVWIDANNNGVQDSGEAGAACVTVKLIGAGADGVFGNADDICKTTTTDSCGYYKFTGLTGDQQYQIQFGKLSGYDFTAKDQGTSGALDSDADVGTGLSHVFTLAAGENNTSVDAGLSKKVTACIVGSSTLYEGEANCYQVKLSGAVSTDTWVKVSTVDGSAKRTSTDMSNQEIMAGGKFDVRNYWGQVVGVYYDQIPNNLSSISYGTHAATGPTAMTADYALVGTDCRIDADGSIMVKVAAGQTSSSTFSLEAWQERVYVDKDIFPYGGYKETAWESMTLRLSDSSNANVAITCSDLNVNIGDTTCYTLFSPIALDLDGNGIQTTALIDSKGTFDLLGTGTAVHSGWLSSGDAFLAIDANGNGKVDDISELFGGNKGEGFAKLATFDTNADGVVDASDADFAKLLVWQDLDGNHQTDAGELRTLAEAGIASLTVDYTDGATNQLGNVLGETSSATRTDGSSISMVDVYFNVDADGSSVPALDSILSSTNDLLDNAFGAVVNQAAAANDDVATSADSDTLRQLAALLEQQAIAA